MQIRPEERRDYDRVFRVNEAAFGREAEAKLVDALREQVNPVVSLVAEDAGDVVGHILFTPVHVTGNPDLKIMGLGPVAVAPKRQRSGIGSQLVRSGLEMCKALDFGAVVVLGHPEYYPRFGFVPASRFGLACEFDVPDEVFMAVELHAGYLAQRSGTVKYHEAFRNV